MYYYLALPVSEEVYVMIDFRKVLSQHVYTADMSRVPSPRGMCRTRTQNVEK